MQLVAVLQSILSGDHHFQVSLSITACLLDPHVGYYDGASVHFQIACGNKIIQEAQ